MTDDQFWRIVIGGGVMGLIGAFQPLISKWLRKIGYTGSGLGKDKEQK